MWTGKLPITQPAVLIAVVFLLAGFSYSPAASIKGIAVDTTGNTSPLLPSVLDSKEPDPLLKAAISENYGKLPLRFEENNGKVDETVKFLSRGNGYTLFLTSTEAVLSLRQNSSDTSKEKTHNFSHNRDSEEPKSIVSDVIRLKSIGSNPNPRITGLNELPGKSNYFIGNDSKKWHTDVSNYAKVKIEQVYPGIDLIYYGNLQQLEFDWVIAPGADPGVIQFKVEGKGDIKIDDNGNLVLDEKTNLCLKKPIIYQQGIYDRTEISGRYTLQSDNRVSFQVDKYDTSLALVIDPILGYSTYLGGSLDDRGYEIAVDSSGNAYVTGRASSTDFPTVNPFQGTNSTGYYDVFITKLNRTGNALLYSTYLGGSNHDEGYGIALDSSGNAYVTGYTYSTNFPTVNPIQASRVGTYDAFIAKLNSTGDTLVYSTYFGGSTREQGEMIAVDASGNAYVVGSTNSTSSFPTANPFQAANAGGYDAFIAKLNPTGNALEYSTYIGGSDNDEGYGIAVDAFGNAYVTGLTNSTNFPTANPYQAMKAEYADAFVLKLNSTGNALVYSTYLGGNFDDRGNGITVSLSGNAFVMGSSYSNDFPTINAFQTANAGSFDIFITKLNFSGNALEYSTYIGGSSHEEGEGIAVDAFGNAYVVGWTLSTNFPTVHSIQATYGGGDFDAFVSMLNSTGDELFYSTYLGGTNSEEGRGIAVDVSGNAYVTGLTLSTNFPTVNPYQATKAGNYTAFITKITSIYKVRGNDVLIDFGTGTGIWARYNDTTWSKLHNLSPESIAIGDLDGNGQDESIFDFGASDGIWVLYNNTTWTKLHSLSPEIIATGDMDGNGQDEMIVDFGVPFGIYVYYNNTTWTKLHSLSPEIIATGDIDGNGQDDCIIDFGASDGIWILYNNTTWTKLHSLSPEIIATGDLDGNGQDEMIVDFGAPFGIYAYNNTTWTKLHSLSPEIIATGDLDGTYYDEMIVDFGAPYGIYVYYNNTTWNHLHNLSAEIITTGDLDGNSQDEIIVDFGAPYGIYVYYNITTWNQLHSLSPEIIATGNMDSN